MTIPLPDTQGRFSQADLRSYRTYRDQHGRTWGASVENRTSAPCGPMEPRFKAPLYPPDKYIRITDPYGGDVRINYDQWESDQREAHAEYDQMLMLRANEKFGAGAWDAVQRKDPVLLAIVGNPPDPIEPIWAMRDGEPWILGLSDRMPKSLAPFFRSQQAERPRFVSAEEEEEQEERAPAPSLTGDYPIYRPPGQYEFSDGQVLKMRKADALAREAGLQAAGAA